MDIGSNFFNQPINMTNRSISTILFLLAGTVLLGLISRWHLETWKVVDSIIILTTVSLGVILRGKSNHGGIKAQYFLNKFKTKKFLYWALGIIFAVLVVTLLIEYRTEYQSEKAKRCDFVLSNVQENRYNEDKDAVPPQEEDKDSRRSIIRLWNGSSKEKHNTFWEIDGLIRNSLDEKKYLKSMIVKIYTDNEDNIFLTEGWVDVGKLLEPGKSYPFQVRAQLDRTKLSIDKYFDKDDAVRVDLYPYFSTCN